MNSFTCKIRSFHRSSMDWYSNNHCNWNA